MNQVVALRPGSEYTGAQLALIKRTVAKDTNSDEFDLFMSVAGMKGLDPFSKQIAALVFNKDKPEKRNMAIVTTIEGMRAIAARSRAYRPDEDEPEYTYDQDAKGPLNPLGIVKAAVRIYIADVVNAGGWKRATGVAYWEEFAPIKDEWAENDAGKWKPTGKQTLDTGGNWGKMPRVMLAKCAEAQVLRKAFPEDLSGLCERAELDRAQVIELTATEVIGAFDEENRLNRIGAANGIMFQLSPASPLENIPLGQVADRIMAAAKDFDLRLARWFESANRHPLQEFWARQPTDALELKKALEANTARLVAEEAKASA